MKTNSLENIDKLLAEKAEEQQRVKRINDQLAEMQRAEKERRKAELKAAKREYKESVHNGETWDDLVEEWNKAQRIIQQDKSATSPQYQKHSKAKEKKTSKTKRAERMRQLAANHKRFIDPAIQSDRGNKRVRPDLRPAKLSKVDKVIDRMVELNSRMKVNEHIEHNSTKQGNSSQKTQSEELPQSRRIISREFSLPWDSVKFLDGQIIIRPFKVNVRDFTPFSQIVLERKESRKSFNYLREYFKEKLPEIKCYTSSTRGLVIIDNIKFDTALLMLQKMQQTSDDVEIIEDGVVHSPKFDACCERGKRMTDEEFRKYKSEFIDYLINIRHKSYSVIPCQECMRYEMSKETYDMEDAFMFIVRNNDGSCTIVYENLNIDRSTLLFRTERGKEMEAARQIFTFMNGKDTNKRSSLRSKWVKMRGHGVVRYKSLNHTDISDWRFSISYFRNY